MSATFPPDFDVYRQRLLDGERTSQDIYDKTVLTLSGGALGVSFIFLKDIVGGKPLVAPGWLLGAWIAWATSAALVLVSLYLSICAHRRAISMLDSGKAYVERAGGWSARLLLAINPTSGVLFLVGVLSVVVFVRLNLR